jgi:hypothetical protein
MTRPKSPAPAMPLRAALLPESEVDEALPAEPVPVAEPPVRVSKSRRASVVDKRTNARARSSSSRVAGTGSSASCASTTSCSRQGEEEGADAGRLASSVRGSLFLSAVALHALRSAVGRLVGLEVVRARNANALGLAAKIGGTTWGRQSKPSRSKEMALTGT